MRPPGSGSTASSYFDSPLNCSVQPRPPTAIRCCALGSPPDCCYRWQCCSTSGSPLLALRWPMRTGEWIEEEERLVEFCHFKFELVRFKQLNGEFPKNLGENVRPAIEFIGF